MRAALAALAGLRQPDGRLLAVFGDMLELGADAARLHRELGAAAARAGVDELVVLGEFADEVAAGARGDVSSRNSPVLATPVADRDEALRLALSLATPLDVVLVKASRGLALETVARGLIEGRA
jgi:UDP-N-acetylmuramoyl-tripeptide--D-alanyl-D-alanine ligase